MYLEKIHLKSFRNLEDVLLELNPHLNLLVGANGQGKTNMLEAIYLLAAGNSHRTKIDQEMINWERDKALVQVLLERRDQQLKISMQLNNKGKTVEINSNPLEKLTELIGNVNVVLFSPEDLKLVKGGPVHRRNFIDLEVSQVSSYYYYLLRKYNHVLKQRNNLLKEMRERGSASNEELLQVWDEQLVDAGSKIIIKRLEVIEKLKILARLTQRQITNGSENLLIEYEHSLQGDCSKIDEISLIFRDNLVNNRYKEINRGYTLYGPHRDDLLFRINDMDVRKFGSQGQQRTVALALKLAELEFMKSETGEYPILLLDDVFSELDQQRRNTLLEIITGKIQTFITTTDIDELFFLDEDSAQIFTVSQGRISK